VRRSQIITAIRDLDFDYSLSKLSEEDYRRTRAELVDEGSRVLRALDGVAPGAPRAKAPAAAPAGDDALEAAIAARRKQSAAQPAPDDALEAAIAARRKSPSARGQVACPQCGRSAHPDEAFCPRCGARISPEKVVA
jgi:DNA-directed RNA polymerase subunit RPC12/RpoP